MTALGGYVIGTKGQVCVVPKLSRVTSYVQNPAPQGEKVAHWLKGGDLDCLKLRLFPRYHLVAVMVRSTLQTE